MQLKITIPKPCLENWEQMTPNNQGRHCNSCSKTVVDFTKKTNSEIATFLFNNPNACGRFLPNQLNRNLLVSSVQEKNYGLLKLATCAAISLTAFNTWSKKPIEHSSDTLGHNFQDSTYSIDTNNIRFQLIANKDVLNLIQYIEFKLGAFSMHFDYFQNDGIMYFLVPDSVVWEKIEISIHHKNQNSQNLTLTKIAWENLRRSERDLVLLNENQIWLIDDHLEEPPVIESAEPVVDNKKWIWQTSNALTGMISPVYGDIMLLSPKCENPLQAPSKMHPPVLLKSKEATIDKNINTDQVTISSQNSVKKKHSKIPLKKFYIWTLAFLTLIAGIWKFKQIKKKH